MHASVCCPPSSSETARGITAGRWRQKTLVCTAGAQSESDKRPAGRWWEAWDGRIRRTATLKMCMECGLYFTAHPQFVADLSALTRTHIHNLDLPAPPTCGRSSPEMRPAHWSSHGHIRFRRDTVDDPSCREQVDLHVDISFRQPCL